MQEEREAMQIVLYGNSMSRSFYILGTFSFLFICLNSYAQPGISEITNTASEMKGWFDSFARLCLVVAGCFGILGGVRIYRDWNLGLREITWPVTRWFLAAVFLVMVRIAVKVMFL